MTYVELQRPHLAGYFARVALRRAVELGAPESVLLDAGQLRANDLEDGDLRVSPQQLGGLFRAIWVALDDELMGFAAAPHRFGMFALMARSMASSSTLGDALRYSVRFYNLTSRAVRWELVEGDGVELRLLPLGPRDDPQHFLEEFLLLVWHRFCNWLVGERIPLRQTQFSFAAPAHREEYRLMFPGPVVFDQPCSAIRFGSTWLDTPVSRTRQELRRYLQRLPDEWFIKQNFDGAVATRVQDALMRAEQIPNLDQLAASWHLSGRTLHRQLSREGASFRRISEQVRRDRAVNLLLHSSCQVREIARRLDMTEPAFSRAFKQWTGMTPLTYRRTHG